MKFDVALEEATSGVRTKPLTEEEAIKLLMTSYSKCFTEYPVFTRFVTYKTPNEFSLIDTSKTRISAGKFHNIVVSHMLDSWKDYPARTNAVYMHSYVDSRIRFGSNSYHICIPHNNAVLGYAKHPDIFTTIPWFSSMADSFACIAEHHIQVLKALSDIGINVDEQVIHELEKLFEGISMFSNTEFTDTSLSRSKEAIMEIQQVVDLFHSTIINLLDTLPEHKKTIISLMQKVGRAIDVDNPPASRFIDWSTINIDHIDRNSLKIIDFLNDFYNPKNYDIRVKRNDGKEGAYDVEHWTTSNCLLIGRGSERDLIDNYNRLYSKVKGA